jgi:hypothetical protein
MRNYEPVDDGSEPTDFDVYYDIPAQIARDVAARVYIKIERDPKRTGYLDGQQNKAIIALLRWIHDNRAHLRAQGHELPDPSPGCGASSMRTSGRKVNKAIQAGQGVVMAGGGQSWPMRLLPFTAAVRRSSMLRRQVLRLRLTV